MELIEGLEDYCDVFFGFVETDSTFLYVFKFLFEVPYKSQ